MSKRFMHVSIAILCLAWAYHLGHRVASAQTSHTIATMSGSGTEIHAITDNGEVYMSADHGASWVFRGSVFGGPTPVKTETWGKLKARYR